MTHAVQNEQYYIGLIQSMRSGHAGWGIAGLLLIDLEDPDQAEARWVACERLTTTPQEIETWQKRYEQDQGHCHH